MDHGGIHKRVNRYIRGGHNRSFSGRYSISIEIAIINTAVQDQGKYIISHFSNLYQIYHHINLNVIVS